MTVNNVYNNTITVVRRIKEIVVNDRNKDNGNRGRHEYAKTFSSEKSISIQVVGMVGREQAEKGRRVEEERIREN